MCTPTSIEPLQTSRRSEDWSKIERIDREIRRLDILAEVASAL
jgi:hypothetical protein